MDDKALEDRKWLRIGYIKDNPTSCYAGARMLILPIDSSGVWYVLRNRLLFFLINIITIGYHMFPKQKVRRIRFPQFEPQIVTLQRQS